MKTENVDVAERRVERPGLANQSKGDAMSSSVDTKLQEIMKEVHTKCVSYGDTGGYINYLRGANIVGFIKVADAMLHQGVV